MERNYNNNLEIKESEVAEMNNTEKVVNEIKIDNKGVNEMEKIFDMGKIVDYVVKAIENSKVEGIKEIEYALGFDTEEVMTEQEQEYCKKILSLIEISNSTDYIEKLFTAIELDIFDIKPSYPDNLLSDNFCSSKNDTAKSLTEPLYKVLIRFLVCDFLYSFSVIKGV